MNNLIIDILEFDTYKKKKDILIELKSKGITIDERSFRQIVSNNNKLFASGDTGFYIAHSNEGYKKTCEWEEIKKSINNNRRRALTMLIDCNKVERQFQRRNNLQLDLNYKKEGKND